MPLPLIPALMGMTVGVVSRVLVALGLAVTTVTGVALVVSNMKAEVMANMGAIPAAAIQLIGLSGGWVAMGILFGAMTTCVTYWTITKATSVLGVGGG